MLIKHIEQQKTALRPYIFIWASPGDVVKHFQAKTRAEREKERDDTFEELSKFSLITSLESDY